MRDMRTWSYTIMGNSQATDYWFKFTEIVDNVLTDVEKRTLREFPDEKMKELIEQTYEDLVSLAVEQKSRLAYQVLGVFLMDCGAKMTNALRELILIHSRWEDEKDQLFDEKDRDERFFYLSEFREAIKNYKEGVKKMVTWGSNNQVVEKLREQGVIDTNYPFIVAPNKTSIKYDIEGKAKKRLSQGGVNEDWIDKLI